MSLLRPGALRRLGQHWGNKTKRRPPLLGHCSCCVHRVADLVEAVVDEMAVGVQRHRGRGVAEHLLDDLDVSTARDREACGSVPELVRVQVRDTDGLGCGAELFTERAHPQRLSASEGAEDQLLGTLVRDMVLELGGEERRDRDLAALMGLGGSPDQAAALDRCHRRGDDGASSGQVESPDAQSRQLAESDTGVGEEHHDEPVGLIRSGVVGRVLARLGWEAGGVGEVVNLVMGQVQVLVLGDPREVDAVGDVASEPPVVDGHVQDQAEDAVDLLDGAG